MTRDDIIMTSLPKTMEKQWGNAYLPETKQIINHSKGIDESYPKTYFLLNLSPIFYFFLTLHLILGKVTKFPAEKFSTSEVISQKPYRGCVENTPVLFGLNKYKELFSKTNNIWLQP